MTESNADLFAENSTLREQVVQLRAAVAEYDEQQKATAEILRVISSSPTDIQPVFDAIAESAARLCGAIDVLIREVDGDTVRLVAHHGELPLPPDGAVRKLSARTVSHRALLERRTIHIQDMHDPRTREQYPDAAPLALAQTMLAAPLLREAAAIGVIILRRREAALFSDKQVKLLETFAAQAVIAIENVRLFKELQARKAEVTEALEQQTATAEILKVIASSPSDVQPVFDAIVETAKRLLGGFSATVTPIVDGMVHLAAYTRIGESGERALKSLFPAALSQRYPFARAVETRAPYCIGDVETNTHVTAEWREMARQRGFRSVLFVPMLREGVSIGTINVTRREPGAFSDHQINLLKTFADQAVIAIENVRLFNETREALEQQTVISEILRIISSSPTDTGPVFDAIVKSGAHLFGGMTVSLNLVQEDGARVVASTLPMHDGGEAYSIPRDDDSYPAARAMLRRETVQIPDILASDWVSETVRQRAGQRGWRAIMIAPLLRESTAIGAIAVNRANPGPFTEKQIALLQTFADQAVIAIENVRLFKELQARNTEVTEALEQQTATADILKVISSSPTDTQPVFDAVAESAARLCGADDVVIRLVEGNDHCAVAHYGPIPVMPPHVITRGQLGGRAIIDAQTVHIPDVTEANVREEFRETFSATTGQRTFLAVPLLREGEAIGLVVMRRLEVRPFTDKQIKLLETFAAQAVIAIENVRLFKELQARNAEVTEALEQQTATSEILRVISSNPTDVMPVLQVVTHRAAELCDARDARLFLVEGETLRNVCGFGELGGAISTPLSRTYVIGRAVLDCAVLHIDDITEEFDEFPDVRPLQQQYGTRTMLAVPLVREGKAFGGILIRRKDVRQFTQKQIELIKTFADQAVIAIENVRLFKELQVKNADLAESLDRQTATTEILRVISSSPTDIQPVLDAVAKAAARLCNTDDVYIRRIDKETTTIVARVGEGPLTAEGNVRPLRLNTFVGAVARERRTIHIPDMTEPHVRAKYSDSLAGRLAMRTLLYVPLLREGEAIGVIVLRRNEVRPFTDKQIQLLETFAAQAVIAIENVRLFNEIQEKSRQLEVASRHKSEFLASMSHELRTPLNAILGFNEMIIHGLYGEVPSDMKVPLDDIQSSGKHLLRLINNVLDLAKIEAGRMDLALADYSIQDTAESVRSALRPLAAEKGLEFIVTVSEDIPLVYGDSGRIMQCLINLAGNSLKFTKAGKVEISVGHHDGKLTCCVSDTGVGIPPDNIGSLFTEFKQTDATIASEYGGTGLGLSITKKFIEMHGGRIWVESEVGQGSRFSFEIPLRAAAKATEEAHA